MTIGELIILLNFQDNTDLNNTLQITMQPDGAFLCFGSSNPNHESTLSNPTVEVINIYLL